MHGWSMVTSFGAPSMCLALCSFKSWKGNKRGTKKGKENKPSRKIFYIRICVFVTQLRGTRKKLAASLGASRFSSGAWLKGWCGAAETTLHPAGTSRQRGSEPPWQLRAPRNTGNLCQEGHKAGNLCPAVMGPSKKPQVQGWVR